MEAAARRVSVTHPPFNAGTPETAPPAILAAYQQRMAAILPQREAEARQAAALMENAQ